MNRRPERKNWVNVEEDQEREIMNDEIIPDLFNWEEYCKTHTENERGDEKETPENRKRKRTDDVFELFDNDGEEEDKQRDPNSLKPFCPPIVKDPLYVYPTDETNEQKIKNIRHLMRLNKEQRKKQEEIEREIESLQMTYSNFVH